LQDKAFLTGFPPLADPGEAMEWQRRMGVEVIAEDRLAPLHRVAGADVHYLPGGGAKAAVTVLSYPGLEMLETAHFHGEARFPYVPGLLALREAPLVLSAFERLHGPVDLLLVDGQGLAHPRRFGLACHLGVALDLPAIGVAKSWFVGQHTTPGRERGAWQPLIDGGEVVGAALRTRAGTRPVYVSIGHRVSLPTAIAICLACSPRYRIPDPLRLAHQSSLEGG
jgi:deoxyribonuclease V